MKHLRRSELVLIAFFVYTPVVGFALPLPHAGAWVTLWLNAVVLAALLFLAWVDSLRCRLPLGVLRDWFPLPLMLLAYREMGWFALPHTSTSREQAWVVWDRLLLNNWGLRAAIECLGPVFPSLLEIAYMLVYAIGPFSLGMLYYYRKRSQVDSFLFTFLFGVLFAEALFPYFPSEPPRTVFPGADLPSMQTIFRGFNHWYLGNWGIHTSVFPSAHVSGAFAASFGMARALPEQIWVSRLLLLLALLIATATVYGRYHYLVDALAGFAVSLLAALLARLIPGGRS